MASRRALRRALPIPDDQRRSAPPKGPSPRRTLNIPEDAYEDFAALAKSEDVSYPVLFRALLKFYQDNATA